jgi:membrane-bound serine protease (ClpP class)
VFLVASLCILTSSPVLAQRPAPIYHVTLAHGVTPPAAGFAGRALQEAVAADASVLVVQISDGGSVLAAVWSLARELHAAPIPIVIWIGPGPINGGPAAALLLAAGDIAVMAPGSTTGFAFPLASAPSGFADQTRQLLIDDVVREVNGWQTEHGRNVDWLERAVRSGAMIDAERARTLDPPLIDLVAATFDELQLGLTGRQWVDSKWSTTHVRHTRRSGCGSCPNGVGDTPSIAGRSDGIVRSLRIGGDRDLFGTGESRYRRTLALLEPPWCWPHCTDLCKRM